MTNFLLKIWGKLFDHILGVLVAFIFSSSVLLEVFTRIKPITRLIPLFIMWRWSGWIILLLVIVILLIRNKIIKKRLNNQSTIQKPPKYHASHDKRVEEREFGGVIWKIFIGTDTDPSKTQLSREGVWAWPFPRAYCPECDYELERKSVIWYCMPCRKNYKIPKELRENTWEKIRRNYERLIVQWGYNNFGLGDDNHKPFRVVLRDLKKDKENQEKFKNV